MRQLTLFCALLAGPVLAAGQNGGQAIVISGYAGSWMPVPGVYALPSVPLVNTPSVSLDAAPFSQPVNGPFAAPTWYRSGSAFEAREAPSEASARPQQGKYLNRGLATFQDSEGVARLMAEEHLDRKPAARVYSNQDVAQLVQQLNQSIGLVKYNGKTERLD
jgi:hypothetical protein